MFSKELFTKTFHYQSQQHMQTAKSI